MSIHKLTKTFMILDFIEYNNVAAKKPNQVWQKKYV